MNTVYNALDLLGRIFLAAFFVPSGIAKIAGYTGVVAYMTSHGVPGFLLPFVILAEVGGGSLVLLGWRTRIAALLLGGFAILAVLVFHLNPTDGTGRIIQMAELAVGGGLWVLAAHGAGGWSLDATVARARARRDASRARAAMSARR
ncbi:MAG: DoxX family protein [Candidimonas sp.]|nr:MAG: DoxX family protein [Candidimonas sp.]